MHVFITRLYRYGKTYRSIYVLIYNAFSFFDPLLESPPAETLFARLHLHYIDTTKHGAMLAQYILSSLRRRACRALWLLSANYCKCIFILPPTAAPTFLPRRPLLEMAVSPALRGVAAGIHPLAGAL